MVSFRPVQLSEIRRGSKILYGAVDGKSRHGIVLELHSSAVPQHLMHLAKTIATDGVTHLLVIAGTSKVPLPHRSERFVRVAEKTRPYVALRLEQTTYFKENMIEVIPITAVTRVDGSAPPMILIELDGLIPCVHRDDPG